MPGREGEPAARPRGLGALTVALFAVAFGANVPTPLLLVYRETLGLSTADLTAVFGSYALGLLPALLVAGAASDAWGRRRVAVPFVALSAAVSLLFVPAATSLPLLYAARFGQGVVSGVVFAVASAWLQELAGPGRPRAAAVRTTLAMTGGFALGPLAGGLLAAWAPGPTVTPYVVHAGGVAVALAALATVPETVARVPGRRVRVALGLPPGAARPFWTVLAPTAVGVYAFPAVSITLLPLLVDGGALGVAGTGALAGLTLGAGTAVAPLGRRLGPVAAPVGAALGAAGFAGGLAAVLAGAPPLLVPVGLLLGAGSGLCLTAGLALTAALAPPATRGAVNSAFYALAYAGFAAPLLLAWATAGLGVTPALGGIATAFAVVSAWLVTDLRRRGRPEPVP